MDAYNKVSIKVTDTQAKKLKTAVKSKTRTLRSNTSENEFKKAWRKWSASWVITDHKTKNEAKKCI